jgi:hypothetical protein
MGSSDSVKKATASHVPVEDREPEPAPPSPRAFRIPEVCQRSGLGRTTIYEAIKSRALIARRYRRCTVVLADDLAAFLRNLPTTR